MAAGIRPPVGVVPTQGCDRPIDGSGRLSEPVASSNARRWVIEAPVSARTTDHRLELHLEADAALIVGRHGSQVAERFENRRDLRSGRSLD